MTAAQTGAIKHQITYSRDSRDYDCHVEIDGQWEYIGAAPSYLKAEDLYREYCYSHYADNHTPETAAQIAAEMFEPDGAFTCPKCGQTVIEALHLCVAPTGSGDEDKHSNLRHPQGARVYVPKYDDLGEIVDRYQSYRDRGWYYAVKFDLGDTIYALTDADVSAALAAGRNVRANAAMIEGACKAEVYVAGTDDPVILDTHPSTPLPHAISSPARTAAGCPVE